MKNNKHVHIDFEGEVLIVSGLSEAETIAVYDLQGKLLSRATVGNDGRLNLSLHSLPTGVYVMKVGQTSYKIKK